MLDPDFDRARPEINTKKVCFVISKSRELRAVDEGVEADASNPTDDASLSTLTESAYATFRLELVEFSSGLDEDEAYELVALAWLGRGDYDSSEWQAAMNTALERRETSNSHYLLGIPLLPDYLEEGLNMFGENCRDD